MAQNIILKRSSLPGKVPDNGSLNVGEIAVNTYDGKLFIKRSGNLDSIEGIVVTNSITTGSITLTRTGSFGELVITQDANITRDLYVTNDIIGAGDIDISGNITGSSALLSGSLILSGSQTITNNLTVLGEVNARQFNISVISSSVLFQSGSTKFGDTSDDTHSFTGSVSISGSLTTIGTITGTSFNGAIAATNGVVSGAAQILITELDGFADYNDGILTDIGGKEEIASSTHTLVSGSSQLTSSFDERYSLSGSGVSSGPNTFDFNLDPEAAGTVNFIEDSTGNTQAIARTGSFDVVIGNTTHLSVSASAINVTTGSITANYMHLAKYISESGDLDFNI